MALKFSALDLRKTLPSLSSEAEDSPFLFCLMGDGGGEAGVVLPRLLCEPILYGRPLKDDWQEARRFIKHTRAGARQRITITVTEAVVSHQRGDKTLQLAMVTKGDSDF